MYHVALERHERDREHLRDRPGRAGGSLRASRARALSNGLGFGFRFGFGFGFGFEFGSEPSLGQTQTG